MCGIAGLVSFDPTPRPTQQQLLAMCDAMQHRGPDDCGTHLDGAVGIAMRRLSIIDLGGGRQPIFNEDRSVAVVFNGEIYNYRDLRAPLEARGHRFATDSDTEVLVHLYEEKGPDFVEELNGMFAIALYDARRKRLVLARDHLGIKPVFFSLDERGLVFGSEVKVLLASGWVKRELDVDQVGQFLAWEYVPGSGTLLQGVRKLEAGHLMVVDVPSGLARVQRYWDLPLSEETPAQGSAEDWAQRVDEAVARSVRMQLMSDVPLGAFLSGGVDSSLVVSHMGGSAQTFSIGFDDPTYNELPWAARVAEHLGVTHDTEVIRPQAGDLFDRLMHFMDDPIADFSIFPTYMVCRHARRKVTVALSGDGGDELFGGYETYLAMEKARQWERVPALLRTGVLEPAIRAMNPGSGKKGLINKAKRFVEGLEHDASLGHARWRVFVGQALRASLFTPEAARRLVTPVGEHITALARRVAHRHPIDRALYIDTKSYLVDNCLVKMDRMSMAVSLEARVPLLDKELATLAFRVPVSLKVAAGRTKVLLKQIAARRVPRPCVYRPKEGFSIPIKSWLRAELRPLMEDLLAPRRLREGGLFDLGTVQRLKREHLDQRANHSHVLWALMVLEDWRRRWAA